MHDGETAPLPSDCDCDCGERMPLPLLAATAAATACWASGPLCASTMMCLPLPGAAVPAGAGVRGEEENDGAEEEAPDRRGAARDMDKEGRKGKLIDRFTQG
ncbi:hypothetical protein Vafri_21808 [Volvox africanus]|uniref:Uncharacterized protein n=1 Tax=Volvox africanus TaxID=51714 RepID=A0A8J4FAU2_9CHLO|nr:hypothetical protein Vafri_21808 [Volvox africanus]